MLCMTCLCEYDVSVVLACILCHSSVFVHYQHSTFFISVGDMSLSTIKFLDVIDVKPL